MTPEEIKSWLGVAALLISVGGVIYNWLTSGGSKALKEVAELKDASAKAHTENAKVLDARCDDIEREHRLVHESNTVRFQAVETSIVKLEEAIKHLPDRSQSHRLELAVTELTGKIATLEEKLRPLSELGDRLQDLVFEQARSK